LEELAIGGAEFDVVTYGHLPAEDIEECLKRATIIAKGMKRHRVVKTALGTFVKGVLKLVDHHKDKRLHPEFKQHGARTGRFSTKTPNSQNMPRPDTDEFGIRKAFVAPEDKDLIVVDYGQLEMRIMAHFSQDEGMLGAIRAGMDLHCFAVEKMYGIPYADVTAAKKRSGEVKYDELTDFEKDCLLKRQTCKNTGFAIIYGAGAPRISAMLEIPIDDAKAIVELYFEAFPGVKQFMDDTQEFCEIHEYVTTLVGRRRRLPDINHHQYVKRGHAGREAINAPIQGSAQDITKASMINIEYDRECQELGVKIVNQIHDELVMECPKETSARGLVKVQDLMELPFGGHSALCVPTPTDGKIVSRWDLAK
jgi:DNA polymerase-1